MIDHTGIASEKIAEARAFYDAIFAALGGGMLMEIPKEYTGGTVVIGYGRDHPVFWVSEGSAGPGRHTAFTASRAQVEAFYTAALAAGGHDNGKPGLRPEYHADYYAAFVHDPDGNNIEAVCHEPA